MTKPPLEHTFLFADLAGFTALTEAMGDEDAADLADEFVSSVRELLPDYAAEEIKLIGDAAMIRAEDAAPAIQLSLRIVHEVGARHYFPTVRVGLHTGPAVQRQDDWFGATVNLAARVSGLASGGEVLLTGSTRAAAGEIEGVAFKERGREQLRNIAQPVLLYAAAPVGEISAERLPIDPVCRMAVDPDRAAGMLIHDGVNYYFCSLDCVREFAAEPERHIAK